MPKLFGFEFQWNAKSSKPPSSDPRPTGTALSPVPPENMDGALNVQFGTGGGYYGYYLDLDGTVVDDFQLINRYREMQIVAEVDEAIDQIINELVIQDDARMPVSLDLDYVDESILDDRMKIRIQAEFDNLLKLIKFHKDAYSIMRQWYIDGRIYYHLVVDEEHPDNGIQELRMIDPRTIRKIREVTRKRHEETQMDLVEVQREYFVFNPMGFVAPTSISGQMGSSASMLQYNGVKITCDSIAFVPSGLYDANKRTVLSWLHKCVAGNTRIRTPRGWTRADSLVDGDAIISWDNGAAIETTVKHTWSTGTKPVYRVRSLHHSIDVTADHRLLVKNANTGAIDYCEAQDLCSKSVSKKDCHQLIYGGWQPGGVDVAFPDYHSTHPLSHTEDLNLPEMMDADFARLFGFLMGDGHIQQYWVTFAEGTRRDRNELYAALMTRYFNNCHHTKAAPSRTSQYTAYQSNSANGVRLLKALGFANGAKTKRVPAWVFQSTPEIRRAFVRGFFDADGCERSYPRVKIPVWTVNLANEHLLLDLKELWSGLGYSSGRVCYHYVSYGNYGPVTSWSATFSERPLPPFENILDVTYIGETDTYDIEVAHPTHNFIANQIVSHNSIKPLNLMRMIEDSCVIYRVARAPERRVFYIDVGNLPKQKAEQYLYDIMQKYRNKIVYDVNCLSMDTQVPLLDGRTLSITDISMELEQGKILWAYSCHPETGAFAPGLITFAGVTRRDAKVMRLILDNGKTITCTPDHKFPVWGRGKTEAKDLLVGDSMIPWYTRERPMVHGKESTYQQVFQNNTNKWQFTHRLVSQWKDSQKLTNMMIFNELHRSSDKKTVHHCDYNRTNNAPENLTRMNREDHFAFHQPHCGLAGKKGGPIAAKRCKELGIGIFAMNFARHSELGRLYGPLGGATARDRKLGFHGLSKEETIHNSKLGVLALQEKLATDSEFNASFRQSISDGWGKAQRQAASERGKLRSPEHFQNMNMLANISRWQGEDSDKQRKQHSERQTINYPQELCDIVLGLSKNLRTCDVIPAINAQWGSFGPQFIAINGELHPRNRGYLNAVTQKDLSRIVKQLGFSGWREFKQNTDASLYHNHKITKIEYLDERMDTGTLTIDGKEIHHNFHTFALDAGVYTCNSGEIRDDRKFMSIMEDFWLPRREGGKGTEITTLAAGQNLSEMEDVNYFRRKLYRALGLPPSRIDQGTGFNIGRASEISRDELRFMKFVHRLQMQFSTLFDQLMERQLRLKNVLTEQEWWRIKDNIRYTWQQDSYFEELKSQEMWTSRLNLCAQMEPFLNKYFSTKWVQRTILKFNDDEWASIREEFDDMQQLNALPVDEFGNPILPEEGAVDEFGNPIVTGAGSSSFDDVADHILRPGVKHTLTPFSPADVPEEGTYELVIPEKPKSFVPAEKRVGNKKPPFDQNG